MKETSVTNKLYNFIFSFFFRFNIAQNDELFKN